MENDKWKACPFCGSTDLLQTDRIGQESEGPLACEANEQSEDEWFVVCGDCGAMGPMCPSAEKAQAAWNHRADS